MSRGNAGTAIEGEGSSRRRGGIKAIKEVRKVSKETEEETDPLQREGA